MNICTVAMSTISVSFFGHKCTKISLSRCIIYFRVDDFKITWQEQHLSFAAMLFRCISLVRFLLQLVPAKFLCEFNQKNWRFTYNQIYEAVTATGCKVDPRVFDQSLEATKQAVVLVAVLFFVVFVVVFYSFCVGSSENSRKVCSWSLEVLCL